MIGLDTNVLVRSLTQDDPSQARLPTELIERRFSCVIERLLQAAELVVQDEQEVFTAMVALKEGRGSFADALIGVFGQRAGCTFTATCDRKALRLIGFVPLEHVDD